MIIKKRYVEENESGAYFTAYLLEDSKELLSGRKRPVVVIAPGGGYLFTSDREAEPIALKFLSLGYHAVVLRYTTGDMEGNKVGVGKQALKELAHTIRYLRRKSDLWMIDSQKVVVCGFSAGAHLAASLGVHWQDQSLLNALSNQAESDQIKPNALILGYALLDYNVMLKKAEREDLDEKAKANLEFMKIANKALTGKSDLSQDIVKEYSPIYWVSQHTPPTFLWHTAKDNLVYAENSLKFALELAKHNVPYELHVFQDGEHGLSLANEVTANKKEQIDRECEVWFDLAVNWLKKYVTL
ncbi:alpha/beta hydrolase [Candidatus Galacturonibacter soehngenii]|uniref:Alpha/beta hydrolase n=1 Tax=Candidatus Galacturonatibacter soehngenii TaxID=2307010 RepID=A0A7V7QJ11_9FIRM|nr:alpha/beta hydrolase [Candidatus Galacturonibacter soehngenii]KAB1437522.1 alpha/beta hydrolase [Candidatus Galacturonibacter soehngenii]